jgi:hypothetical protein
MNKAIIFPFLGLLFSSPLASQRAARIERPIPYPLPTTKAWEKAVQKKTRTRDGLPGPKYWTNYATYKIDAELAPKTAKVKGHLQITYENRSPRPIHRIKLHLRQNLHKAGSLRNRFVEITGGVQTSNIQVNGKTPKKRMVLIQGTVMTIRLSQSLKPQSKIQISMDWTYKVPKAGAPRNGQENNHVFWIAFWYPQVAVFDDVHGWVAEQYMSNAEFYMDYADYELNFKAPEGFIVQATGELSNPREVLTKTEIKRLAKAKKSHQVIHILTEPELKAGKATRKSKKGLTWRFHAEKVRDIAVSVSDQYIWDATHAVIKDKKGPGKDGLAMIHALYRPKSQAFKRAAEYGQHTIEYMSQKVFPYQWPKMTACEGIIGGGMEFPMMTICGGRGRDSLGVVTHETIHMWFPMLVGSNEKAFAWQDEGLTTFFTNLTTSHFRTKNRSKDLQTKLRNTRRRRGHGRFFSMGMEELAPIMRHGDRFPGRWTYSIMSYMKTSAVLEQLRSLIGDEAFFRAFREYAKAWAFKHPTPQDFFATFNRVAGENLDWYFREWFFESWKLDQAILKVNPGDKGTEVVVGDLGFASMPMEIEVSYKNGKKESKNIPISFWLSGRKQKKLHFGPDVSRVQIDPNNLTIDIDRKNNIWRE